MDECIFHESNHSEPPNNQSSFDWPCLIHRTAGHSFEVQVKSTANCEEEEKKILFFCDGARWPMYGRYSRKNAKLYWHLWHWHFCCSMPSIVDLHTIHTSWERARTRCLLFRDDAVVAVLLYSRILCGFHTAIVFQTNSVWRTQLRAARARNREIARERETAHGNCRPLTHTPTSPTYNWNGSKNKIGNLLLSVCKQTRRLE